jgi:putative CocE/NonD family hydrolase
MTFPFCSSSRRRLLQAPALMITGWYDWGLGDVLASWELVSREATQSVSSRCRLLVTPSAHNMPGYHEGKEANPELERLYRTADIIELLLSWYSTVRENRLGSWPKVIYYPMGANEWFAASEWPPAQAQRRALFLGPVGTLSARAPLGASSPDGYVYDPDHPTPTVGGSIGSSVYPPGRIDVNEVQKRSDVLTYTTRPLDRELDVIGPLRLILYASSSAIEHRFLGASQ